MKKVLSGIINSAAKKAFEKGLLTSSDFPELVIEIPKIEKQGDFSTNMAMVMAKTQRMAPRKIAEILVNEIDSIDSIIEKTEIAGPGFINFFIKRSSWHNQLEKIYSEDKNYGSSETGKGTKIQVEFVSANPTGPLHVGHGRGAVVGDTVAKILSFCGYEVQKEYYINDSGNQINTLGLSVLNRYRELKGLEIDFPENCYQGKYIYEIAELVIKEKEDSFLDIEEEEALKFCSRFAADYILNGIKEDLKTFGVEFDNWFSEQSLFDSKKVEAAIDELKKREILYEKEDALWFNTERYGDEKDRVVVRSNGQTTYYASDIAYHKDKFDRGFDRIIDVWGADHHGYIKRINGAIESLGNKSENFDVILIQLVSLLRAGEPVAMSTRSGEFVTLKEVVDETGRDAARFMFLTRHYESSLEFDLELAKKKTNENPVFYVQYVHARITSIIKKAEAEKEIKDISFSDESVARLTEPEEMALIKLMNNYPDVVEASAKNLEPHKITFYLRELSSMFHNYYNKHKVLTDDIVLTKGRLYLILAVKKVIRNGLELLNISAPDKM